ncbi:MAG: hypothetical protein LBQ89_04560 [Treponema sp.]|jgi:hypothetical protein|nr:hypothetical protein [Treponema sp.]
MEIKKTFEKFDRQNTFIKITAPSPVDRSTKAALNRKGNQMFNEGDVEGARRIFMTTGYSDGLSRVGDCYKGENKLLEALRMYWLAHDRNKSQPLIEQLAGLLQGVVNEDADAGVSGEGGGSR